MNQCPKLLKLLDKKDPVDRQLIDLVKAGELTIGCFRIKEGMK